MRKNEITEELKSVLSGKTLDALLPPLAFGLLNNALGFISAFLIALGIALTLGVYRILTKQKGIYALGGFFAVAVAGGYAYYTRNPVNYFLGSLILSGLVFVIAFLSLIIGKPLAAWLSHLSRGWPLGWFWRKDVKPAYREVTIIWAFLLLIRFLTRFYIYQRGNTTEIAYWNTLTGWPMIVPVLTFSYIYGIWRLKKLKGPGVEEFREGKNPPWKGQTRGF